MKSAAIYCVTYNSYSELYNFLESASMAARNAEGLSLSVFIADNTDKEKECITADYPHIKVTVFNTDHNCGYLGAVQQCMKRYSPEGYDYVAISNVDVELAPDSLNKLSEKTIDGSTGWIAPQIYSRLENRDRNPAILERYSKYKLAALLFLYRHPHINHFYESTFYKRKRIIARKHEEGEEIYAGHGSFMIFTKQFICKIGIPQYPIFLFGEEIYLAEMCQKAGLKTVYVPSIKIIDSEHCSTSVMHSSDYYKFNAESIKYALELFYA